MKQRLAVFDENVKVQIGSQLQALEKEELIQLLQKNISVFVEYSKTIEGIDRKIIKHQLEVNPKANPVHQKMRYLWSE